MNSIFKRININQTNTTESFIVSDSILYNKEELFEKLMIKDKSLSDKDLILLSYETWNANCLKYFVGDFSFAIWNKNKQELFCARDHLGVKPFNYFYDTKKIIISSDIKSIISQNDIELSIDERYIADSISIIKSEKNRTIYNEIEKLPPAHYLLYKDKNLEIKEYWKLKSKEILTKSDDEIIKEFKSLLIESVKCRIQNIDNIGTELSGGIDSSSLTAVSQFIDVKTFSHILPDHHLGKTYPYKDERKFIKIITDHCKIQENNFIKSENGNIVDTIKENLNDLKSISQQNFGMFSDYLYSAAQKEDITVLLSGFGGDEVVTSKTSGYLKELYTTGQWKELRDDLKNQNKEKHYYKYFLKNRFTLLFKIYKSFNKEQTWWENKFENLAINKKFFEKLKIKDRYYRYHHKSVRKSAQEKSIERLMHPHLSQRLENCSLISRKYGFEYRYPLLDIRLIEYYLSIPLRLKARNGIGRYIIRKAMERILPKEIQWRIDKSGATIPTVFMRTLEDKDQIIEIINRSKSNEKVKQYIDLDKFEQWFEKFIKSSENPQCNKNPGAFYNYLKLILFIEQNPNLF